MKPTIKQKLAAIKTICQAYGYDPMEDGDEFHDDENNPNTLTATSFVIRLHGVKKIDPALASVFFQLGFLELGQEDGLAFSTTKYERGYN